MSYCPRAKITWSKEVEPELPTRLILPREHLSICTEVLPEGETGEKKNCGRCTRVLTCLSLALCKSTRFECQWSQIYLLTMTTKVAEDRLGWCKREGSHTDHRRDTVTSFAHLSSCRIPGLCLSLLFLKFGESPQLADDQVKGLHSGLVSTATLILSLFSWRLLWGAEEGITTKPSFHFRRDWRIPRTRKQRPDFLQWKAPILKLRSVFQRCLCCTSSGK